MDTSKMHVASGTKVTREISFGKRIMYFLGGLLCGWVALSVAQNGSGDGAVWGFFIFGGLSIALLIATFHSSEELS